MIFPDRASERYRPLRIGIDARLVTYRRGIGTYVHHLLHEFAQRADAHEFVLYVDDARALAELPSGDRFRAVLLRPGFYPFWEQVLLRSRVAVDSLDVLHCPANTGPVMGLGATRLVLTIHDVMFLMPLEVLPASPSAYQRLGRLYRRTVAPRCAARADRIITVSERSATDIGQYLDLGAVPVDVIPEAASADCRVIADPAEVSRHCVRLGVRRPFVLAPGAVDPRKNTARVIAAFAATRARLGEDAQLVVFGLTPAGIKHFAGIAAGLGITDRVCLLTFVSDEELVGLYNGCLAFLYPSLYEGFGLPVLEAMACGASVATSHAGSLPEIAGDAAEYADPLDVQSIGDALLRASAARGEERRAAGLARARDFSWRSTAELTIRCYEAAAG